MRVAIVDDESRELETLRTYLAQYAAENDMKIDVNAFPSGDALLADFRPVYDVIIFDIEMPGTNGMDTARQIRSQDENVAILFITNVGQYAIHGYEVEAVDYALKPVQYHDFALKLGRALKWAAKRDSRELVIETVDGSRRVRVADIIYVETLGHYLIHHMAGKDGETTTFKVRSNMREYEALLSPYNFCQVHKSYLVNLEQIEEIRTNEVLAGQVVIPIGRAYKNKLMQEYLRFARN